MESTKPAFDSIKLEKVCKSFEQVQALNDVTLSVAGGVCLGVLGQNGAGKSTLIKIIVGILAHTSGDVCILGEQYGNDKKRNAEIRRNIGYLPELPTLYPEFRTRDFLKFIARVKGVKNVLAEVDRVVSLCNLGSVYKTKISDISKGYKQRVALAQAMINSPPILVLDEVTSGFDPGQRVQIIELLKEEVRGGRTIVFSSHSIEDTVHVASRIVLLKDGFLANDFPCPDNDDGRINLTREIMKNFTI